MTARVFVPSTWDAAKVERDRLMMAWKAACDTLRAVPGVGSGIMGLTPDAVRATPDYRQAKHASDAAFSRLRAFNTVFTQRFKAEMRAERRVRFNPQKDASHGTA